MTWVLILLFHATAVAPAAALTSVPGFATKKQCEDAGRAAAERLGGGHPVRFTCVAQGAETPAKP